MKKVIALILAIVMALSFVACSSSSKESTTSTSASASTSTDTSNDASSDASSNSHYDRDTYTLVYMCSSFANVWCKNIETAMKSLQEEYNFTLLSTDVNYDFDLWMTNVETYCDQGVDGFVMNADQTITQRTFEVTNEYKIPWLSESTAVRDDNGNLLTSGVELNAYQVGADVGGWIVDNYKDYFGVTGDIDQSKVGYISIQYSSVESFNQRCKGAEDAILTELPNCTVFRPDLLAQGNISADAAYNEVSPILSAHPEIEYWLITGVVDDWGLGATRAAESVGVDSKTLITTAGGEDLILEWDNGYDGCWKACCYYEAMDYVQYLIPGMIDILEGKTTMKDLWPEWKESGSDYSSVKVGGTNCTKDTYKSLIKMRY